MAVARGKSFNVLPLFDPDMGRVVRTPSGYGQGWWAGAPCATFDATTNTFYLVYRQRQPLDEGRGVECRIAVSDNGIAYSDIWALPKASLSALSVERAALLYGLDGRWRLYIGHVSPEDRRWRISLLEADEPDRFEMDTLMPVLTAEQVGAEGVMNPNVYLIGRMVYMIVSYATHEVALDPAVEHRKHAGGDIYSTGLTLSRSGAAISGDGRNFHWIGDVSPIGASTGNRAPSRSPIWDAYCRRLSSITPLDGGGFLGFYDGGPSVVENHEEKTGVAMTFDLRTYYSLSPDEASLVSPFGSGSLRYVDVLPVGHELFYYYEMARQDGGHELRVVVTERD